SCDFSNARLTNSSLQNITFDGCKLLGIKFDDCKEFLFSINCNQCILDLSSFYGLKLDSCSFQACQMNEVDFTEASLKGLSFDDCDLTRSIFYNSELSKCDFQTAENFSISPKFNNLKGATFSRDNLEGLLSSFQIIIK
ncbi:MAG: fluoroquinolone resistance protein, partial [Flavobacteriales bacterium]